ncbi:MAG: hypothetical protein U0P45_06615 [Acidimicrobiales bacterium]
MTEPGAALPPDPTMEGDAEAPDAVGSVGPAGAPSWRTGEGWGTSRRATVAAWALFAVVAAWFAYGILHDDFRRYEVLGDSSSYLLQAESLGFAGHDLRYDQQDVDRFRAFRWADEPYGLYFQRSGDGWAFAKPYGYSVVLAPFLRAFGPRYGVSLANLALLAVLAALGTATLRLRFRGAIVPLVLGVFLFGSPLVFYAHHLWVEVFWAPLVLAVLYATVRACRDRSVWWGLAGAVLAALLLAEKAPALPLVAPVGVLALMRLGSWPRRAAVLGAFAVALLVAVVPYQQASDGRAANPYGGQRYYARSYVPFDGERTPPVDGRGYGPVRSDETFSVSYAVDELGRDWGDKVASGAYYVVGRHTGLLPFEPLALFVVAAALVGIRRAGWTGRLVLVGLLGYVAFYVLLFPHNYNGGGQTLGNRYFLQVYPAVLVLAATARLRVKPLAVGAAVSAAAAWAFMSQHYTDAGHAIRDIDQTNPVQRLLPFEGNQDGANYFRCGRNTCEDDG